MTEDRNQDSKTETKNRIGVFVCHCGKNIAETVDVEKVKETMKDYPGVVFAEDYSYMCSDPGQRLVETAIKENSLTGIVVAACTPNLHETTFRNASIRADLNPYRVEMANIREKCSWVHEDKKEATEKAIKIAKGMVEKVKGNKKLTPHKVPVTRKALVIGAGVAGIQAALDLANMGYKTIVVEKEPTIGGKMAKLSETFPTLDCSQCILTPKMVEISRHENIELLTYTEVEEISGYVGNFTVKIRKKPRYVDPALCKLCDDCSIVCPQVAPDSFNLGLVAQKAIYIPFPQAVPATYTLDEDMCLNGVGLDHSGLNPIRCTKCREVCEPNAINFDDKPEYILEKFGAIVVATGFQQYDIENMTEYGGGINPDVITGLEFERLLSASGPTGGKVIRPSDGKVPKEVVFVQCSGSRDEENHKPYCSKICCMYTAKHALLYRHSVHDGQAYVFYIDIRSAGKDYEEFTNKAMEDERILYLRGKVGKLYREGDKTIVFGVDTLSGLPVKIKADLVVLAQAMIPDPSSGKIAQMLHAQVDANGFMKEAHPKLRPVESLTAGIFLAGTVQGPRDIPETVAQASGAASKAAGILSSDEITHNPETSKIDEYLCTGCSNCVDMCPYRALELNSRDKAEVNPVLCEGCGICATSCPTGAITLTNSTEQQVVKMIETMLGR